MRLCVCLCVYMGGFICVGVIYVFVCICLYVCMFVYMFMHVCMWHVCAYEGCVCLCVYLGMFVCMYSGICVCICLWLYVFEIHLIFLNDFLVFTVKINIVILYNISLYYIISYDCYSNMWYIVLNIYTYISQINTHT